MLVETGLLRSSAIALCGRLPKNQVISVTVIKRCTEFASAEVVF